MALGFSNLLECFYPTSVSCCNYFLLAFLLSSGSSLTLSFNIYRLKNATFLLFVFLSAGSFRTFTTDSRFFFILFYFYPLATSISLAFIYFTCNYSTVQLFSLGNFGLHYFCCFSPTSVFSLLGSYYLLYFYCSTCHLHNGITYNGRKRSRFRMPPLCAFHYHILHRSCFVFYRIWLRGHTVNSSSIAAVCVRIYARLYNASLWSLILLVLYVY